MSNFDDIRVQDALDMFSYRRRNDLAVEEFNELSLENESKFLRVCDRDELDIIEKVTKHVIRDMDKYGVCVIDEFLGKVRGAAVLAEVIGMYQKGNFEDGRLVSGSDKADSKLKTIRGDQISWIDGSENNCKNIGMLINMVDSIIMRANSVADNGVMGNYNIVGRTKVSTTF